VVILVKRVEKDLKLIRELDNEEEAQQIIQDYYAEAKFNMDVTGTYYLMRVEKIEIKRS